MKKLIYIIILVVLFLPLLQKLTGIPKVKKLKGYFKEYKYEPISVDGVLEGKYQSTTESYIDKHIGYRPELVRLHNQIDYSLFGELHAAGVIVGKDKYIYEHNYIKAHYGQDFIGDEQVEKKVLQIKRIQDSLAASNTHLFVLIAPGKGSFYPEFIPDRYGKAGARTNYEAYLEYLEKYDVAYLDFNRWFREMKDTSRYTLYPQCGIHWSTYGAALAFDSIISYMENVSGKKMVNFHWDDVLVTDSPKDPDYDVGGSLNLMFHIDHKPLAYAKLKFGDEATAWKPNFITVADSFYWQFFSKLGSGRIFQNDGFLYYNRQYYNSKASKVKNIGEFNLKEEIEKQDFVMLLTTDANLYKFPYGFADSLVPNYY